MIFFYKSYKSSKGFSAVHQLFLAFLSNLRDHCSPMTQRVARLTPLQASCHLQHETQTLSSPSHICLPIFPHITVPTPAKPNWDTELGF